jgi:aspartyl-tRNA synthetase
MLKSVFKEMLNVDIQLPLPRYEYDDIFNRYGSDKPDTRFGLELIDLSSVVRDSGFKVFAENVQKGGVVKGIVLPGGGNYSRKQIDDLTEFAKGKGASGLAYILRTESEIKSPISKFLSEAEMNKIIETTKMNVGDALFIVSGKPISTEETLGQIRLHLGKTHNLIRTNEWHLFFVMHFPLFYYNEEYKRFEAMHNIVSHPREVDMPLLDEGFNTSTPAADINHPWRRMKASQYDLVINGWEIASGGQRINRRDLQEKVLDILGIDNQRADRMFGFLLKALEYGAPPHAGIALGLDRLIAIMTGSESIRDVMAFPKTAAAISLMDGCPTTIEQDQLDELGLIIKGGQAG